MTTDDTGIKARIGIISPGLLRLISELKREIDSRVNAIPLCDGIDKVDCWARELISLYERRLTEINDEVGGLRKVVGDSSFEIKFSLEEIRRNQKTIEELRCSIIVLDDANKTLQKNNDHLEGVLGERR